MTDENDPSLIHDDVSMFSHNTEMFKAGDDTPDILKMIQEKQEENSKKKALLGLEESKKSSVLKKLTKRAQLNAKQWVES
jgi:hypothetical protein